MDRSKHIDTKDTIRVLKEECYIGDLLNLDRTRIVNIALDDAVAALETISHLTDRPCSACEFHTDAGCSKFDCVFDKFIN